MRTAILFGVLALACCATSAAMAETTVSPNGKLVVEVGCTDGRPNYSATYWGDEYILQSPLGLTTNIGDFTEAMELLSVSDQSEFNGSYSLHNIKKSNVEYTANARTYTFGRDGKPAFDVTFVVEDCDLGFRYKLYPKGETLAAVVEGEATGFVLPETATTYLCPQMKPMSGFARTAPSYETNYALGDSLGKNGIGYGFTFPCLFRRAADKGWMLISETGLDGSYVGSHLESDGTNGYRIAFPDSAELNGVGSTGAAVSLPAFTPWRTISFGHSLRPIAKTTIAFDLVEPKYAPSRQYEYGKGTWSWIMKMDPSCNFDEQVRYIDFAADMGYQTVLVDALWDTQIGRDKIEQLARYGREKGVDLYLWYNSNGAWNDAPQGPRNRMDRSHVRRQEMQWLKDNGIRGIKVDFFGGDKQPMIQLYEDILADANDFGIEVIFHGCTLPRGWDRMYPNFIAAEAVLASENLHFSQEMCDMEASNATIHPLVRNTVGSMDFGGSALNKFYNSTNKPNKGSRRMTSDVFALATAVLFQSPVQHFALAPNNLTDAPAWAIDFMREVPTTWDDIHYFEGEPGSHLIMGRRHGDTWYVAGINAQDKPVSKKLKLPMARPGDVATIYTDDASLNGAVGTATIDKDCKVKIEIPRNGGLVIKLANNQAD